MEELKALGKIYGKLLLSVLVPFAVAVFGGIVITPYSGWFILVIAVFVGGIINGIRNVFKTVGALRLHALDFPRKGHPKFMQYRRELWRLQRKRSKLQTSLGVATKGGYSYNITVNDLRDVESAIAHHKGLTD